MVCRKSFETEDVKKCFDVLSAKAPPVSLVSDAQNSIQNDGAINFMVTPSEPKFYQYQDTTKHHHTT